jgi:serine/threonine-protein kinase
MARGVARALGRISVTQRGQIKGKLSYMAPEQLSDAPLDRRADVFAASAVLWQALTGERLFQGRSPEDLAQRLLAREVAPPSQVAPDVPKRFDSIVLRGLELAPAERWKSAMAMAEALESVGGLASHREVGLWVRRIGASRLSAIAAKVAELERKSPAESLRPPRRLEPPLAMTPAETDAAFPGAQPELSQSTPPGVAAQVVSCSTTPASRGRLWQPMVAAGLLAVALMVALSPRGTPRVGATANGAPAVTGGSSPASFELSAIPASSAPTPRCTAPEPSPGGPALPGNDTVARSSVVSASAVKTVPPRPAPVAVRARSTAKSAEPAPQSRSDHVLPLYARR